MDYKFYIPASTRYVQFNTEHEITMIQLFEKDGTQLSIMHQNGESPLEVHELISYGEICLFYKFMKNGLAEYDPYAIFPKELKKAHLQ